MKRKGWYYKYAWRLMNFFALVGILSTIVMIVWGIIALKNLIYGT